MSRKNNIFSNCSSKLESGVAILGAAISLPVIILAIFVVFDLTRIYLGIVFTQDVALTAAKLANASSQNVDTPTAYNLIKPAPGEDAAITVMRQDTWDSLINPGDPDYHGAAYFTAKELRVFNLAYGYMAQLNPNIAFPIPVGTRVLGGVPNCTILMTFADLVGAIDLTYNYSRIYTVKCSVPTLVLNLLPYSVGADGYMLVTRSAYSHQSGGLTP
ncbi:MAG: hypothetical protein SGJ02_07930 [bacterium]|nr:hypothetical protein [bacterium]